MINALRLKRETVTVHDLLQCFLLISSLMHSSERKRSILFITLILLKKLEKGLLSHLYRCWFDIPEQLMISSIDSEDFLLQFIKFKQGSCQNWWKYAYQDLKEIENVAIYLTYSTLNNKKEEKVVLWLCQHVLLYYMLIFC